MMEQLLKLWASEEYVSLGLYGSAQHGFVDQISFFGKDSLMKENVSGWTPLMYAISQDDPVTIAFLLEIGVDHQKTDKNGDNALILACKYGSEQAVKLLVKYGANIHYRDSDGWTPLFHAASMAYPGIVKFLLDQGARVNIRANNGLALMSVARTTENKAIIQDLYEQLTLHTPMLRPPPADSVISMEMVSTNQNNIYSVVRNSQESTSLSTVLDRLGLGKYYPLFEKRSIGLSEFLKLTDENLQDLGIKLIGPRKKITNLIRLWQEKKIVSELGT